MADDELLAAIRAAEVDAPPAFDDWPLEVEGGKTLDLLEADVVVRPRVALDALSAGDASIQVYSYSKAILFQGCRLIEEARPPFVLFAFGRVAESPSRRFVGGALRLYSDDSHELSQLAQDPSLAFALALERYGLDFRAGEGRPRVRFVPVVLIPRNSVDLTPPVTFDRIWAAIASALDVGVPAEETIGNLNFKIPDEGPIQLLWPFVLEMRRYVSDVRSRRRGYRGYSAKPS